MYSCDDKANVLVAITQKLHQKLLLNIFCENVKVCECVYVYCSSTKCV